VVVPCYNEETRFPAAEFLAFSRKNSRYHFLLVNDGSTDKTSSVLKELARENPDGFEVLDLERNSGKAEAVRQGMLKVMNSGKGFAAFWDADLATPLDTLPLFVSTFEERDGLDIMIGSRVKLMGRQIQRKPIRHYLGRIFATLASLTLGLGIYDTQCGAKMFRINPKNRDLFNEHFLSRWIFDVELFARYLMSNRTVPGFDPEKSMYEYSLLSWNDVHGSKVKAADFFYSLKDLILIRSRYGSFRSRKDA